MIDRRNIQETTLGREVGAHPSKLAERAAASDAARTTRRGKPSARIRAVEGPRKRIDIATLRAVTEAMPVQTETACDLVRRMRDTARY